MKLSRARAHLLVIDVQDKLLPAIHRGDEVAARCAVLAQAACLLDLPVTISQQYPRGLGGTLESVREAAGPQARVFDKTSFSCAGDPAIRAHLDATASTRPQIVLCGIEAHVCVAQTALDLHAMGLAVAVVTDAIGSRDPSSRDVALLRLAQAGVVPVTSEMVMFEWIGDAGSPEFKRLLPLIK
jgi:nicotinamidase-related amidase